MSEPIVQLSAADFEEAMDFMNLVFSGYSPTDFAKLLPLLYRPTDEHMACNYAIRQQGRIRAVVGLFPLQWQVGQTLLKVAGIGGVSTHPNHRSGGLMKQLMQHCVAQMKTQGYHLSWLGGQRQRYLYHGYEKCGVGLSLSLSRSNLRHCFAGEPALRFEPLAATDQAGLSRAQELHGTQPAHARRVPEDFYLHCVSWHHRPFAALEAGGRMVGYLVANAKGDAVVELVGESEEVGMEMARCWAVRGDQGINLDFSPTAAGLIRRLGQVCEGVSVHASGNWQVFAWEEVLGALLQLHRAAGPLPAGRVVVGIEGYGRLALEVESEQTRVTRTDEAPAVEGSAPLMLRLLCGPLPPSQVVGLPAGVALLGAWCPLPLFWARQDGV
ncbi:MAG: GNAT family N-acetyltransferase [Candidatus Latescibacteria bacterium]|nr:GNAT family N-acetyltransferase [Candidatus Latescibacterota bacterium]